MGTFDTIIDRYAAAAERADRYAEQAAVAAGPVPRFLSTQLAAVSNRWLAQAVAHSGGHPGESLLRCGNE